MATPEKGTAKSKRRRRNVFNEPSNVFHTNQYFLCFKRGFISLNDPNPEINFVCSIILGASYSCYHPVVCTLSICNHSPRAQGYGDPCSCAWCVCHLLVTLLHLFHLHGFKRKDNPPKYPSLSCPVAWLLQLNPKSHPVSSIQ